MPLGEVRAWIHWGESTRELFEVLVMFYDLIEFRIRKAKAFIKNNQVVYLKCA